MTDFDDTAWAFVQNERLEQTKDYVGRGRAFVALDLDDLKARWVEAFRAFVADIDGDDGIVRMYDLEAEIRLRGAEPPHERVEAEQAAFDREMDEWQAEDPGAWDEVAEQVVQDVVDFHLAAIAAPKS